MRLTIAFVSLVLFAGTAYADSNTAQPALPIETISIDTPKGPVRFKAEVATTWPQQQQGLMYRRHMAADAGMLFDFHKSMQMSFWMKNTYLPLDMVFIARNGTVINVAENTEPMSERTIPSAGPAYAVLEVNAGTAKRIGLKKGDKVTHPMFR